MDIDTEAGVNTITQSSVRSSSSKENALKYTKLSGGGTLSAASFACSFFTLLIAIDVAFSITQLVIGVLFKDSCPMNYLIPIYLIVAGAIGLVLRIIMILLMCVEEKGCFTCLMIIFGLAGTGWLIAGCVWLANATSIVQFDNPNQPNTYCHRTVFNFTYVTIILSCVLMVTSICCRRSE